MTSKRISDQINTIRVATDKASVSPEAALAFLRSAGIVPQEEQLISSGHKKGATAKLQAPANQPPYGGAVIPKTDSIYAKSGVVKSNNDTVRSATSRIRYTGVKKAK